MCLWFVLVLYLLGLAELDPGILRESLGILLGVALLMLRLIVFYACGKLFEVF